jgi:outer membrane protein OmpA-like peptidoglycan-associated protein
MILSEKRAAAAVDYLVVLGINRNRLVAKGYGDTHLLNNCSKGEYCTEEEHQINRRTEVKIISE